MENTILELDDNNKYLIVEKISFENNSYAYLVDIANDNNYMFVKMENDNVVKVTNQILLGKLMLLISEN